jgi:Protein of unknown function (DUF669)
MADLGILEFSTDIAEAEAPPPLPIGEYNATVESLEPRVSNTSGRDYLGVTVRISPDDFPPDFDGSAYPDGVQLRYNRLFTEDNARNRYTMRKWCEALGAPMGKQIDPNDWIGMSLRIGISHRKWEDEDQANISKIAHAA